MICDFNYGYTGKDALPLSERAQSSFCHLTYIPERTIAAVIDLAKTIFWGLAAGITFGQVSIMNSKFLISVANFSLNTALVPLHILGVFAPKNAYDLMEKFGKYVYLPLTNQISDHGADSGITVI